MDIFILGAVNCVMFSVFNWIIFSVGLSVLVIQSVRSPVFIVRTNWSHIWE
jgi:hypothetical protein